MAELAEQTVREALQQIADPEIGVNIWDLGLVYGWRVQGGEVSLSMTMTSMGCPFMAIMQRDITDVLMDLDGVEAVAIDWTFTPPWTPQMATEDGRVMLESMGVPLPTYGPTSGPASGPLSGGRP